MRKIKIGVYVNMYDRIINKNGVTEKDQDRSICKYVR